jgi:hypothetical protein
VPERHFAFTLLTNSVGGAARVAELLKDDWVLRRFAGIRNLPAVPRPLSARQLARYEGAYTVQQITADGTWCRCRWS